MKKVFFVSWHLYDYKRKAGFHWLASSFHKMGWDVVFVTTQLSLFSLIKDPRFKFSLLKNVNKLIRLSERLTSYIHFTLWHPINPKFKPLNRLLSLLYPFYNKPPKNLIKQIEESSLIIFESTSSILLFNELKKINPTARFVYRVSDDMRILQHHQYVLDAEYEFARRVDLVSTPCNYIFNKFKTLSNVRLHYHGIDKESYDKETTSPYKKGINAVFIGKHYFDYRFIEIASALFPNWQFHIIDAIPNLPKRKNIIDHGGIQFSEIIPFIRHADVGLHTLAQFPHSESFTDTLKVIQYTYNHLPIVAPDFLRTDRGHMFYYKPNDRSSIKDAIMMAIEYDREKIKTDDIITWDEVAQKLL